MPLTDVQYLREQAKLTALDTILKHAYEILQTSDDNREKTKDTHLVKLELLSNATTIDSALHCIRSKQQQEQQQQKKLGLDSTTSSDNSNDNGQQATTGSKQTVF